MRTIPTLLLFVTLSLHAADAPVILLKFDDLTQKGADKAKGEAVSSNFEAVADIVRRLGSSGNGAIGSVLIVCCRCY